jgi:hypothetical protein
MHPAPTQYLRALRILHLAMTGSVAVFGLIVVFLKQQGIVQPVLQDQEPLLMAVAGCFMIGSLGASVFLFRRKIGSIRSMATLDRKLASYQSAQIIRWALAEGPALLVIILMMLTSSPLFFAFAAAAVAYLFGSRPPANIEQACATMNISREDRERWERGGSLQ